MSANNAHTLRLQASQGIVNSVLISLGIALLMWGTAEAAYPLGDSQQPPPATQESEHTVTVNDGRFTDALGRHLILHGVNIVEKNRSQNYVSWHGPEDFARMREWGFNCIRLGILWDGVEPEPGVYDDAYLARVDERIQWAKQQGIYVLLDMHQDLFSAKLGADGAPEWAVLDEGQPHIADGPIWSTAYFTSAAIQTAFDNFWANKPAPDGIGVQDHFARAWRHVAARYADEPTVVGYDLFNEPFPGSPVLQIVPLQLQAVAEVIARKQGGEAPTPEAIMAKAMEPDGLAELMSDFDVFKAFTEAGASVSMEFERTALAAFNRRVTAAIREVDPNHIIFAETSMLCNAGVSSGVVPIVDSEGQRDPLQAFAPHGYDLVTDTRDVAHPNPDRLALIYKRHAETAQRLGSPVLVGEWGALGGNREALPAAQLVVDQIERYLFSDTYWCYSSRGEVDDAPYFPLLARPYPVALAGVLLRYRSELEESLLTCVWREDAAITAPSHVYLPEGWFPQGMVVELEPTFEGWTFEPVSPEAVSGYLLIPPSGQAVKRRLVVRRP